MMMALVRGVLLLRRRLQPARVALAADELRVGGHGGGDAVGVEQRLAVIVQELLDVADARRAGPWPAAVFSHGGKFWARSYIYNI